MLTSITPIDTHLLVSFSEDFAYAIMDNPLWKMQSQQQIKPTSKALGPNLKMK